MKSGYTCKTYRMDDEDEYEDESSTSSLTKVSGNKIFFYDKVSKESILNLFMEIECLNKTLSQESLLYGFTPHIELHIHSSGGDLFAGMSAYDRLKVNKIPIHTIIEGEVCSSATLIALSGKKRYVTENSMILIHQLSTLFSGND